jgi:hypothetical protein
VNFASVADPGAPTDASRMSRGISGPPSRQAPGTTARGAFTRTSRSRGLGLPAAFDASYSSDARQRAAHGTVTRRAAVARSAKIEARMKVSLFYLPSVGNKAQVEQGMVGLRGDLYDQMLREVSAQARLADDLGYDSISFTEHHFHAEGFELSNNPVLLDL